MGVLSNVLLIGKLKKPYINVHFFLKIFDKEKDISYNIKAFISAPLAQLDRALVYGTKGWGFELLMVHQIQPESNTDSGCIFVNLKRSNCVASQFVNPIRVESIYGLPACPALGDTERQRSNSSW